MNLRKGDLAEALRWKKRALVIYQELKLQRKLSMVLNNTGIVLYKMGDLREAETSLKKSLKIGTKVKSKHRQLFPNIALGNVYRMLRDFDEARSCLHRAYGLAQELQYPREEALSLEFLGDVYLAENQPEQAERFYSRALAIGKSIAPEGDIVMEVHRRLAECDIARQGFASAKKNLTRALEMSRAQGDRFEEGVILRVFGDMTLQTGNVLKAKSFFEDSVEILADIGARYELALSQMASADCLLAEVEQGRPSFPVSVLLNQAWGHATRAMENLLKLEIAELTDQGQQLIRRISFLKDEQEKGGTGGEARHGKTMSNAAYQLNNVIVHKSRKMKELIQLCDLFAQSNEPTLLIGETGTGKELFAQRLHEMSDRRNKPLVTVNVTALPETMFDREFFGHVKGAFSGADSDSPGFAGLANGGTLFLDEIGDLPLEVQPKLLRLLQDGTYQALGDPQTRHTSIRLVAATNADLMQKVNEGKFRSDLYYRLKILELPIPPLRERTDDILLLARHFLSLAAGHHVDLSDFFDRDSLDMMERYPWPGNVREVSMVARRAFIEKKAKGVVAIHLDHPSGAKWRVGTRQTTLTFADESVEELSSEALERSRILLALEENGGSRTATAKSLEMSRATLYRRMVKLGLLD
jgi:transcriptional regulator with GAF, ATPase, and Fis domain